MIIKAVKKPIEIEAIKFTGWNWADCYQFMSEEPLFFPQEIRFEEEIVIETLEGDMTASVTDYIVKGVDGEFYPVKRSIFLKTYDVIHEEELDELG